MSQKYSFIPCEFLHLFHKHAHTHTMLNIWAEKIRTTRCKHHLFKQHKNLLQQFWSLTITLILLSRYPIWHKKYTNWWWLPKFKRKHLQNNGPFILTKLKWNCWIFGTFPKLYSLNDNSKYFWINNCLPTNDKSNSSMCQSLMGPVFQLNHWQWRHNACS